jgi:hypothetical protein
MGMRNVVDHASSAYRQLGFLVSMEIAQGLPGLLKLGFG